MRLFCVVCGILISGVLSAAEVEPCFALPDVFSRVLTNDPGVRAAGFAVDAKREELELAKAQRWPQFSTFVRSAGGEDGLADVQISNQSGIRVSQRLYDFGQTSRRIAIAHADVDAALAGRVGHEQHRLLEAGQLVLQSLLHRAALTAHKKRLRFLNRYAASLTALLETSDVSRTDAATVLADQARARAAVAESRISQGEVDTALAFRVDLPELNLCEEEVTSAWLFTRAGRYTSLSLAALQQKVFRDHPDLQQAQAQLRRAVLDGELRARSFRPSIDLAATFAYVYDEQAHRWEDRQRFGLELNMPLGGGGGRRATKASALAQSASARESLLATERELAEQLAVIYRTIRHQEEQVALGEDALALGEQQLLALTEAFELGATTLSEMLVHRNRHDDMNAEHRLAKRSLWDAQLNLLLLVQDFEFP